MSPIKILATVAVAVAATASAAFAGCYGRSYYRYAPVYRAPAVTVAPSPALTNAGQAYRSYSFEPTPAPTYVAPAPNYYYAPGPAYFAGPRSSGYSTGQGGWRADRKISGAAYR